MLTIVGNYRVHVASLVLFLRTAHESTIIPIKIELKRKKQLPDLLEPTFEWKLSMASGWLQGKSQDHLPLLGYIMCCHQRFLLMLKTEPSLLTE